MTNELNIIIAGKVGTGKSTIAAELCSFLKQKGYNVFLNDEGQFTNPVNQNARLESIKKRATEIRIRTALVNRSLDLIK